jgi:hypothetical protein
MDENVHCMFKKNCRTFYENRALCATCRYNRPWKPDHYRPLYQLADLKKGGGKK